MKKRKIDSDKIFLTAILLLATFLRFYKLDQEGFGNLYYAATVKSMLTNLNNFFYAAFDPGGFISMDKPPVGLWLECLSAAIFGFKGWSLILPQAFAGAFAVWLIYHIVKKYFTAQAGLTAAFFLAITPIFVAANRNNTIDSTLILVLLIAVWLLLRAIEKRSVLFLLLSVTAVGVGFNIKMLQAYMVLPAIYLTYLLFAKVDWGQKIFHLSVATVVLLAVSLSWAVFVDFTPEYKRPIVGSSSNNKMLDLIVGHNALARFTAKEKPPEPGGRAPPFSDEMPPHPPMPGQFSKDMPVPRPPMMRSHLTPKMETGEAGIFRLLNKQLSGQIIWFFPLILIGLFLWFRNFRLLPNFNALQKSQILLWLCWLIPSILYFSFTQRLFHRYYLSMLAPPAAALAAIALIDLWKEYQSLEKWSRWLLPIVFLLNGILQIHILLQFNYWNRWLMPVIIIINAVVLFVLIINQLKINIVHRKVKNSFIAIGLVAITLLPSIWALTPIVYGGDAHLPYAGPDLNAGSRMDAGFSPHSVNAKETGKLVNYLSANQQGEKFLVAVPSAILYGSKLVIQTGEPIITLGGFNGQDETISVRKLEEMVRNRDVRFFLIQKPPSLSEENDDRKPYAPIPKRRGMPCKNLRAIFKWIVQNGESIPPEKWRANSPMMRQLELYEINF